MNEIEDMIYQQQMRKLLCVGDIVRVIRITPYHFENCTVCDIHEKDGPIVRLVGIYIMCSVSLDNIIFNDGVYKYYENI